MESTSTRKPCFLEDDNGLASIADYAFSLSSETHHNQHKHRHHHQRLVSRAICSPRKTIPKNYASSIVSSPRSGRFLNGRFEEQRPYFLDACFLCQKPLGGNTDIFMYRGDTAFCSDECRTEQIDTDEAKDNWTVSVSLKSMRKKEQKEQSSNTSSPNKTSKNYPFQSGAVAAA